MKMLLATLGLIAGVAQASDFTFAADSGYTCSSVCTGFVTSDSAHTVDQAGVSWTGAYYRLTLSVDGTTYTGTTSAPGQVAQLIEFSIVNGVAVYGTHTILAGAQWTTKKACVTSGRGQHCAYHYLPYAGTVSVP